jgi:hypothetical protein
MTELGGTPPLIQAPEMNSNKDKDSLAEQMKNLRKQRMQRETLADPSLLRKLMVTESTLLYNSSAEVVQSAGSLGS